MKSLKIPLIVTLIVLGVGGVALAYFWGAPYGGYGPGPYGAYPHRPSPYMWGGPEPWGMMGGPHWEWGPRAFFKGRGDGFGGWGYGPSFQERLEALSKASGIPVEKLVSTFQKYPMPRKLALRTVALSLLLNKDIEEVAKDFRSNPSLYLWKSGVDPSSLMKKEWEIGGKFLKELLRQP